MSTFQIIVAAENTPYMAWQCKLFHYSCVTRVGVPPAIFVHDSGQPWHPGFHDIVRAGGRIYGVPSYAHTSWGYLYKPRNTQGTLLQAAKTFSQDDYLVLCDADMIFIRKPEFSPALSGSFYGGVNYNQEPVLSVSRKLGIPSGEILNRPELRCGVPHVVPVPVAETLAQMWLKVVDQFPMTIWEANMYALGLAVTLMRMPIILNPHVGAEYRMAGKPDGDMIHYCYSHDLWDKREFFTAEAAERVWEPEIDAEEGSIMAEILKQLVEARKFYFPLGI